MWSSQKVSLPTYFQRCVQRTCDCASNQYAMNWTAFDDTVTDLVEISEKMGIDPEELRRSNVAAKNAIMHLRSVAEQYVAKIKIRNARQDFVAGQGEEDLT